MLVVGTRELSNCSAIWFAKYFWVGHVRVWFKCT